MNDLFQRMRSRWENSPAIIIIFILAIAMVVVGGNHFIEDTVSSYKGLISLEEAFSIKVQIFNWTYWTMSITPQIGSMIAFYIYLTTHEKKYLWLSLGSQLLDAFADVWYRSDGALFESASTAILSIFITILFFSIGSEMFLTFGGGLILKLAAPTFKMFFTLAGENTRVVNRGTRELKQELRDKLPKPGAQKQSQTQLHQQEEEHNNFPDGEEDAFPS